MLDLGAEGVNGVGIHGMGGIGKTTLATAVYNKVSTCFDRYSFVNDIRETQTQTDGVLVLQKKFVSNILRMDSVGSEAKKIIRERVTQFKILAVLDDVDEKFDFEEVLGNLKSFSLGSRFIITSRDIKVLMRFSEGQSKLYEVQAMDPNRSLQLFCKHAFKDDHPLPGFETLSKHIVSTTGGLPLTLKIIGSFLFREEEVVWKGKLKQLQHMPEKGVMDRLIISYNALNREAQQIFLDIACFYIGENKELACYMWSDCKFHPDINVNVLVQRSMIKIGTNNEFQMHDQLRDMGREIVREESIEHPEMRSRIWSGKEAIELLVNNKGTKHVKAISLDLPDTSFLDYLLTRSFYSFMMETSFNTECFTNMSELRYVDMGSMILIGDFNDLLLNLKWIKSRDMARFNMKEMVIVDVSSLGDDCIHMMEAEKLKFLKLSDCEEMSELPEFPETLEMLHLRKFNNKDEDMELRNLRNLKVLKLEFCTLRRINGGTVGMMKGLRELILNDIRCDFDNLKRVIADIGELSYLESLDFDIPELRDVLKGIKLPKSLKVLTTSSCFDNLLELLDLEEFTFRNHERTTTELVISTATKLKSISVFAMTRISMVEGQTTMLLSSLTVVHIYRLQSDRIPNLKSLSNLTQLSLGDSHYLREIRGVGGLKSLQILKIERMGRLASIEGLGNLMSSSNCKLIEVEIIRCPRLRAFKRHDDADTINDAVRIESLLKLEIKECPLLDWRSIPKLSKFPRLGELSIWDIGSKINDESGSQLLEGLDNLGELVELVVRGLAKVERLPCLSKLTKLRKLTVIGLPCLREITGLGDLKSLNSLKVESLMDIGSNIDDEWASQQQQQQLLLEGLDNLGELLELQVSGLTKVERLPCLSKLTKLWKLTLYNLPCLREIAGLGELKSLKRLEVRGCISLERLPIEGLPYTSMYGIELDLRGCTNFIDLDSDLSPLTNKRADLGRLRVTINWPEEDTRPLLRPPQEAWKSDEASGETPARVPVDRQIRFVVKKALTINKLTKIS